MNNKYAVLFIIILVNWFTSMTAGELVKPAVMQVNTSSLPKMLGQGSPIQHGRGLKVNITEFVDYGVGILVFLIPKYGLDPVQLDDVSEGFQVKPVFITYSAWLKVHDGNMIGLVNVSRIGDQELYYAAKKLHLHLQLQCSDLVINYKYLLKAMNIGPTGRIRATLDYIVGVFDVVFDFNNFLLSLEKFKLTNVGRLRVNLSGNSHTFLVNPVINVFMRIFDKVIIKCVQNKIRGVIQATMNDINKKIKKFTDVLKSYD